MKELIDFESLPNDVKLEILLFIRDKKIYEQEKKNLTVAKKS
jgi:hypothetical protein